MKIFFFWLSPVYFVIALKSPLHWGHHLWFGGPRRAGAGVAISERK
jgi:hypothetical protein